MEGKGTPKKEQNQFCHSPSVKVMAPSEVERQDSHAAGVKYSLRDYRKLERGNVSPGQ